MPDRARCKFVCEKSAPQWEGASSRNVTLRAQYESPTPVPEDEAFSRYTPCGHLDMTIDNPALDTFFEPGKAYYIDISPAE